MDYSNDNWACEGSILGYRSKLFSFLSDIVITELDDCLINYLTPNKIYDAYNENKFELNDDLARMLKKECQNKSLIILSNQCMNSKINIDMIKRKVMFVESKLNMNILVLCALKNNKFAKPHTGLWLYLKLFYKTRSGVNINDAILISNEGGIVSEKLKKDGEVQSKVKVTDVDRAFAHNIGIEYMTIDQFLLGEKPKLRWNFSLIDPEMRIEYCDKIEEIVSRVVGSLDEKEIYNKLIFKKLAEFGKVDAYCIIVLGPPRGGKTTIAKKIIEKWEKSPMKQRYVIERLGTNMGKKKRFTTYKKLLSNRISVIIDGECYTKEMQKDYLDYAKELNIPVLFLDVTPGIHMAKILNHVAVEESQDFNIILYKHQIYHMYQSIYRPPDVDNKTTKYVIFHPIIERKKSVMINRY